MEARHLKINDIFTDRRGDEQRENSTRVLSYRFIVTLTCKYNI